MYNSKQFIRTVNWHFVSSCNMSCKYCFVPCCKELPLEESVSVLEKLKGHFDRINFVGGEPTVSSKLIPLVKKQKNMVLLCLWLQMDSIYIINLKLLTEFLLILLL